MSLLTKRSLSFPRFLHPRMRFVVSDHNEMNDEIKLSIAFLALNAGVIALFVTGYVKGGMNFSSVIDFASRLF